MEQDVHFNFEIDLTQWWGQAIWFLLVAIPLARMYQRAGLSLFWLVLGFVPVLGVFLCLLILALKPWPGRGAA